MNLNTFTLYQIIGSDALLASAVDMAKEYSAEIAQGVLYERTVHGYDEEIYDLDEKKIKRVHKYSDAALRDYLRANNPKYRTKSNGQVAGSSAMRSNEDHKLCSENYCVLSKKIILRSEYASKIPHKFEVPTLFKYCFGTIYQMVASVQFACGIEELVRIFLALIGLRQQHFLILVHIGMYILHIIKQGLVCGMV